MIVNIRGTSGSGKSTLVRQIMDLYEPRQPQFIEGRKRPTHYVLGRKDGGRDGGRDLAVLGHYETTCGGCDTIPEMEQIFQLARFCHRAGYDVIFEGLLISADFNRTFALHQDGFPLLVAHLDLDLQLCLDSVNARRRAKDPTKPNVKVKNTHSKHVGSRRSVDRLRIAGVDARYCATREGALELVKQALQL